MRARADAAARFRAAAPAGPRTPWREADWLAVDLELTGLSPRRHEIVAIGAVPVRAGRVVLGEAFYSLVRPERPSEVEAVLVHKLRAEDLADAPPIEAAIAAFIERLAGALPVFHTAAVETAFLGRELAREGLAMPAAADTEVLGRMWLRESGPGAPGLRQGLQLSRLATLLGQRPETPHHALGDALTTAQAFIALATHMAPQTVGSLQGLGAPGARRFGPG